MLNRSGFSLIELMIAVAIVGGIAVIGVPTYKRLKMRSVQSEAKSDLANLTNLMEGYMNEYGQYTTRLDAINYVPIGDMNYIIGFTNDVVPPANDFVRGLATCIATGPATPTCKWPVQYTKSASATAVPGLPAFANTTIAYKAYALGKIDGLSIDSWSMDNRHNMLNVNPVGF